MSRLLQSPAAVQYMDNYRKLLSLPADPGNTYQSGSGTLGSYGFDEKRILEMTTTSLQRTAVNAALEAGKAILEIYHTDFAVQHKEDTSPLTQADQASHEIIS